MRDAGWPAWGTKINHYEDLVAWQFANELADLVDSLTSAGGAAANRSFREQILKSSAKAPAQIAEGFLRFKARESAYYYRVARASLGETMNHLQRGFHRNHWNETQIHQSTETGAVSHEHHWRTARGEAGANREGRVYKAAAPSLNESRTLARQGAKRPVPALCPTASEATRPCPLPVRERSESPYPARDQYQ